MFLVVARLMLYRDIGKAETMKKMTRHTTKPSAVPVVERAAVGGGGGDVFDGSLDVQTGGFEPPMLTMPAYGANKWTVHVSCALTCVAYDRVAAKKCRGAKCTVNTTTRHAGAAKGRKDKGDVI